MTTRDRLAKLLRGESSSLRDYDLNRLMAEALADLLAPAPVSDKGATQPERLGGTCMHERLGYRDDQCPNCSPKPHPPADAARCACGSAKPGEVVHHEADPAACYIEIPLVRRADAALSEVVSKVLDATLEPFNARDRVTDLLAAFAERCRSEAIEECAKECDRQEHAAYEDACASHVMYFWHEAARVMRRLTGAGSGSKGERRA